MGDGGSGGDPQRHAQDPRSRLGKLLRINVNVAPVRVGIYAKGLRNPWRFSFDRATGALWIGDVGQNAWEEIDYAAAGAAGRRQLRLERLRGHPRVRRRGGREAEQVLADVAGLAVRSQRRLLGHRRLRVPRLRDPALRGFYLFADYSGRVWAKRGPGAQRFALPGADRQVGQIASFGEDARGELYVVSLAGSVYEIVPR